MSKIALLSQETIDKIAAGEVVERPSSVVKELVENAIDAGASAITVEIKDGGSTLIRITDNGSGIRKDQVPLAFLRHSTSKITSAADLAGVTSLGFRGEALSSIAAVAHVELITKPADQMLGTSYVIEGGREVSMEEIGAPDGSTFFVRQLFYNTPARRKFLKSNHTEGTYVFELMQHMALSHPEIAFRFINQGQEKLATSGSGNLRDVIYQVFGRQIAANVLDVALDSDDFSIRGFIGTSALARGNRSFEHFFYRRALREERASLQESGGRLSRISDAASISLLRAPSELRPGRYRCQCPSHQTGGAYRGRAGGSGGPLPSCGPQTFPERGHRSGGDLRALRTGAGAKSGYQNPKGPEEPEELKAPKSLRSPRGAGAL